MQESHVTFEEHPLDSCRPRKSRDKLNRYDWLDWYANVTPARDPEMNRTKVPILVSPVVPSLFHVTSEMWANFMNNNKNLPLMMTVINR